MKEGSYLRRILRRLKRSDTKRGTDWEAWKTKANGRKKGNREGTWTREFRSALPANFDAEVKQNLSEGTGSSHWRPFLADDTMGIDLFGVIFPISFYLVKCLMLKVKGWVLIIKNCCVKITILKKRKKKEKRKKREWKNFGQREQEIYYYTNQGM